MSPTPTARVSSLVVYPVKGCAGLPLSTAEFTPAGITHDRSFMVVDDSGDFRSQRRDPRMARIVPDLTRDGSRLVLSTEGLSPVKVDVDPEGPRVDVTVHNNPLVGVDQGDEVAGWLSELFGRTSRLVRVPDDNRRVTNGVTPGTAGFADGHAAVIGSTRSLEQLNEHIVANGAQAVPMARFRPNVVVTGWAEPHTEDLIRRVRVGTTELGYAKMCTRCAVTTVDQETGDRRGPEPLRALAAYRRVADGGVAFCTKFAVTGPGVVSVGDALDVTEWAEAPEA
ncbi:MOSC domain-containing protein [Nocardiopsis sp. SBT366]|uniref:MOSC domain-containing protein n=1 Tax=Nocardiopsis sp. SBT366 TaxID=1580529 RepID=UPI00066B156C|nr:MOSC N-terminal beta barrel domain-containing protein [Nocardiopsis sp. SBT366]